MKHLNSLLSSWFSLSAITLSTLLLGAVLMTSLQKKRVIKRSLPHYRIAIVSYSNGRQITEMIEGYTKTLNAFPNAVFECKWYSARGDQMLLQNMLPNIPHESYDLVVCFGMGATYTFIEMAQRKEIKTPTLFTAVHCRLWDEWITKYPNITEYMTGTVGGYDWKTRLKLLLLLRPDISHVIVPYTPPFDGDHIEMEKIEATLHEYGITVKSIPLEHNSDVPQKIAPFLHEAGALLALRDAVVLVAREQIIKKCNQHSVTIFAADMESVETGAAAALCITEAEMGIYPARQTIDILINKKSPGNVPLIDVGDNGSRFIINEKGLKRQGGEIDKNLLFLIKKANIVRNNTRKV